MPETTRSQLTWPAKRSWSQRSSSISTSSSGAKLRVPALGRERLMLPPVPVQSGLAEARAGGDHRGVARRRRARRAAARPARSRTSAPSPQAVASRSLITHVRAPSSRAELGGVDDPRQVRRDTAAVVHRPRDAEARGRGAHARVVAGTGARSRRGPRARGSGTCAPADRPRAVRRRRRARDGCACRRCRRRGSSRRRLAARRRRRARSARPRAAGPQVPAA